MYAIIRTGGKQYKVEAGDEILVEKLDLEAGAEVCFEVLMLCDGENVTMGDKVVVFKYKAKKNIRKKQGHRQPYTKVKINTIG